MSGRTGGHNSGGRVGPGWPFINQTKAAMAWLVLLLLASILHDGDAHGAPSTANRDMSQFLEQAAAASASASASAQSPDDAASTVTYPPLSPEEIGQSLRDVPIYYIDRRDGGGILVAGGRDGGGGAHDGQRRQRASQRACYFFLEKDAALANLEQVVKGDDVEQDQTRSKLHVSTANLGQLYEKFWSSRRNHDETGDVEFRLIPNNKELLRARFLLTVTPSDTRRQLSEAEGRRLLAKVNAHPKRFKESYNDIPLFVSSNTRLKMARMPRTRASSRWPRLLVPRFRRGKESDTLALPVYFTLEDMKRDMERASFGGQRPERESGSDTGTCIILNLEELLTQMGNKSRGFDYRDVVFIPPGRKLGTPFVLGGDSEDSVSTTATNSMQEGAQYVDGTTSTDNEKNGEAKEDRIFWLRPRRKIRQQDLDKLFGPDRQ